MMLSVLASSIGGQLIGNDMAFSRVNIDSRTGSAGDLFVAIKGDRFDGHDFLEDVLASGVSAAMISQKVAGITDIESEKASFLAVEDTRLGLGALAQTWLNQFQVKKIAITGSSGKTTVKEMVSAILVREGGTLATLGNLNNDIGVPLTLCRVNHSHQFAVIEMGANHVGEIAYTSGLVKPDVALVNNVGPAHLEGFGSIEQVAQAKSEIYESLADDGTAIVNLDDEFVGVFLQKTIGHSVLSYSMENKKADVHLLNRKPSPQNNAFVVSLQGKRVEINLELIGQHNIANALAAIAVSYTAGASIASIQSGLASLNPIAGRLCPVRELPAFQIIDDSYNANPGSVKSAIDVLVDGEVSTCLVLGAMEELGAESEALHREIGQYAGEKGVVSFYALGRFSSALKNGYLSSCPVDGKIIVAQSHEEIAEGLLSCESGKRILIKGSRSAVMENVIHIMKKEILINKDVS